MRQRLISALMWPRPPAAVHGVLARRSAPLLALGLILAFSVGARVYQIDQPCYGPCTTPFSQTIFDETYYVNAARAIAGVTQPPSSPYVKAHVGKSLSFVTAPSGDDPNDEHPQLAKVLIAGGIDLFGDGPWGWRIGSVLFSVIAMVALYALVTGAGGSPWLAVGSVAVMALDNLALVQGRIAMLDIYALAMMLVAGAFYVRRRPFLAGAALGIGACMKEVAFYLLVALVLFEAVGLLQTWWGTRTGTRGQLRGAEPPLVVLTRLVEAVFWTFAVFFGLLWLLDVLVPAWDTGTHTAYAGDPFKHFAHIVSYAERLSANPHPHSHLSATARANLRIMSTPLQWLIDRRPIFYGGKQVGHFVGGASTARARSEVVVHFLAKINPYIIFATLPALALALTRVWRRRDRVALIGAAWAVGTFVPFLLESVTLHRVSYIYYMLIVLPGIYLMTAQLFSWRYMPKLLTVAWAGFLVLGFVQLYPIRTLF